MGTKTMEGRRRRRRAGGKRRGRQVTAAGEGRGQELLNYRAFLKPRKVGETFNNNKRGNKIQEFVIFSKAL